MRSGARAHFRLEPGGLTWLASLDEGLRDGSNKLPNLAAIADIAGVNPSSVTRAQRGQFGLELVAGLMFVARAHGASEAEAMRRLFRLVITRRPPTRKPSTRP